MFNVLNYSRRAVLYSPSVLRRFSEKSFNLLNSIHDNELSSHIQNNIIKYHKNTKYLEYIISKNLEFSDDNLCKTIKHCNILTDEVVFNHIFPISKEKFDKSVNKENVDNFFNELVEYNISTNLYSDVSKTITLLFDKELSDKQVILDKLNYYNSNLQFRQQINIIDKDIFDNKVSINPIITYSKLIISLPIIITFSTGCIILVMTSGFLILFVCSAIFLVYPIILVEKILNTIL